MSNAALSLSFLSPLASGSRPKSRNPSTRPSPRNPNPNPNPKSRRRGGGGSSPPPASRSGGGGGGVATTYTRLPPRDDFALDASSLGFSLFSPSNSDVVTLDESPVPAAGLATKSRRSPRDPMLVGEIEDDDDGEEEETEEEEELFEYGAEEEDGVAFDAALEEEEFVEDGEFEGDAKEKGVPAVMRCFDTAKIYVKAGDGGNGVVAFRREKFVPYGGPSGGDGGRGGDVYIEVDGSMNSLLPFRKAVHFRAGRGGHGLGRKQGGAKGENVVVMVPPGTVIRESQTGAVLLELMRAGERALLLPGGRGGRGNASFKSGTNKVPKIAENGEEGAAMYVAFLFPLLQCSEMRKPTCCLYTVWFGYKQELAIAGIGTSMKIRKIAFG